MRDVIFYFLICSFVLLSNQLTQDDTEFNPSYSRRRNTRRRFNRPETPAPSTSQMKPNTKGINLIEGISNDYPKYLANEEGLSLYTDISAPIGYATCYDDCLKMFTPAIVKINDTIKLHEQLEDAKVGLLTREDGSSQVAYNNNALFYFKNDTNAGDIKGQGFNNTWFLVSEKGEPYKQGSNASLNTNSTSNLTDTRVGIEEPSNMPALSSKNSQHLLIPGYASMLVVPDRYIIYLTISQRNANFMNINTDITDTAKELKRFVSNLGTTPLTYLGKDMDSDNSTYEIRQYYFTTTSNMILIEKLSAGVDTLNARNTTIITERFGNTISDRLYKDVKSSLFQKAVKNSFDSAYDVVANMKYSINMQRPVNSIRVDPESVQKFHSTFFTDTYSSFFLLNKNSTNVVSIKVLIDYNLKNK